MNMRGTDEMSAVLQRLVEELRVIVEDARANKVSLQIDRKGEEWERSENSQSDDYVENFESNFDSCSEDKAESDEKVRAFSESKELNKEISISALRYEGVEE
eukprot:TRINITY_DN12506_c0_g1_i3.p4 TRINITY_DN12506_c0_g1~~TRINITY_DN12506_c0_g1_i3.p4  ORF type:complete len:102 (-),score=43.69 TRINITY_DN12506_c0_g1_i3:394-699(-)